MNTKSGVENNDEIVVMVMEEDRRTIDSGPIKPHLTKNALRAEWMLFTITIAGILLSILVVWLFYRNEKEPGQNSVSYLLLCIPLILGSLFFLLGSQNVLRQFFSLLMLLCAIGTFHNGRYLVATLFTICAVSFHFYMVVIGIMWFTIEGLCGLAYKRGARDIQKTIPLPEILSIVIGALSAIGIYIIVRFLGDTDIMMMDAIKQFVVDTQKFAAIERSTVWTKVLLVGALLFISEVVAGWKSSLSVSRIRITRRSVFCLIIPLSIYPEIFSRFLIFYFAIEMVYVVMSIMGNSMRVRCSGCIVFFVYGVAPNALNILAGPGWGQAVNIKLFS